MAPPPISQLGQACGKWLHTWRLDSDIAQADVAEAMSTYGLAWSQSTVSKLEAGKRNVSMDEFFALAAMARMSVIRLQEEIMTILYPPKEIEP